MPSKHGSVPADVASCSGVDSSRSRASAYYPFALKSVGVLQTLLLAGFAVFIAQRRRAETQQHTPLVVDSSVDVQQTSSAVHVLTDDTLPGFVAGAPDGALLNFHMSTCSHCEALAPEFEAAASELQAKSGVPLASVDISAAPKAVERYGVHRFPTLLWFRWGEPVLELPPTIRQADKIAGYVDWMTQPAVVSFGSREELDEAVPQMREVLHAGAPPVICGFGVAASVYPALEAAAERLRGKTIFAFTEETRPGDPVLRAYYQNATSDQYYLGRLEQQPVQSWVEALIKKAKRKQVKP